MKQLKTDVAATMQLLNQTQLLSKNIKEESENIHNQAAVTLNSIDEIKISTNIINNVS